VAIKNGLLFMVEHNRILVSLFFHFEGFKRRWFEETSVAGFG
jgi:hypothetical protein